MTLIYSFCASEAVMTHAQTQCMSKQSNNHELQHFGAPVSETLPCPCQRGWGCLLCRVTSSLLPSLQRCTPQGGCRGCTPSSSRSCTPAMLPTRPCQMLAGGKPVACCAVQVAGLQVHGCAVTSVQACIAESLVGFAPAQPCISRIGWQQRSRILQHCLNRPAWY